MWFTLTLAIFAFTTLFFQYSTNIPSSLLKTNISRIKFLKALLKTCCLTDLIMMECF